MTKTRPVGNGLVPFFIKLERIVCVSRRKLSFNLLQSREIQATVMLQSDLSNRGYRVERSQSLMQRPTNDGKMFKCFPALPLRMSSVKEKNRGKIRLSTSRSTVSFKEMRKLNKADEAFHQQRNLEQAQSHLQVLEVPGNHTLAEYSTSYESLSYQADENPSHQFFPQTVQTHELFVDLADELSFGKLL